MSQSPPYVRKRRVFPGMDPNPPSNHKELGMVLPHEANLPKIPKEKLDKMMGAELTFLLDDLGLEVRPVRRLNRPKQDALVRQAFLDGKPSPELPLYRKRSLEEKLREVID